MPSFFSVNCSCPRSPFHPSDLGKVNFLCMPAGAIAEPSEAKPRQHQLRNSPPLPSVHQEIRCNIRTSSSHCLLRLVYTKGDSRRVPHPIHCVLPHHKATSLLPFYLVELITFFFPSTGPLSLFLAKLTYANSLETHRDACSSMCLAPATSPWRALSCHCTK